MTTLSNRILQIRKSKSMTQKIFSTIIGVSRSYLSEVEKGKSKPSIEIIVGIATKIPEIDTDWLLTGEGEMYRRKSTNDSTELEPILTWLEHWWENADEKQRHWLEIQMQRCFPEYEITRKASA